MARLMVESGRCFSREMPASALAPHTLNRLGSWLSPTRRRTKAWARVCPALMSPLSSSFARMNVSASSISRVGRIISTDRNKAAVERLETGKGLADMRPINSNNSDLAHAFSGALMMAGGATSTTSMNHVRATQSAAASACS